MALGRHTLVWPDRAGTERLARQAPPPVFEWVRAGRPLIVRRRAAGDPPDACPLALSLPPTGGRTRFTLSLPRSEIARSASPPALSTLFERNALPAEWGPTILAVLALSHEAGADPRVFGSALWQHLSGLPCLRAGSDLDLLWSRTEFSDPSRLDVLLRGLRPLADGTPRLDGELLLPDGSGAQWRELADAGPDDEILLKGPHSVHLVSARTLAA